MYKEQNLGSKITLTTIFGWVTLKMHRNCRKKKKKNSCLNCCSRDNLLQLLSIASYAHSDFAAMSQNALSLHRIRRLVIIGWKSHSTISRQMNNTRIPDAGHPNHRAVDLPENANSSGPSMKQTNTIHFRSWNEICLHPFKGQFQGRFHFSATQQPPTIPRTQEVGQNAHHAVRNPMPPGTMTVCNTVQTKSSSQASTAEVILSRTDILNILAAFTAVGSDVMPGLVRTVKKLQGRGWLGWWTNKSLEKMISIIKGNLEVLTSDYTESCR